MAQPLQKMIASRYTGRDLPVTLVLPDGGRVPLSSKPEIEIAARTWRGLKALAAPSIDLVNDWTVFVSVHASS